MGSDFRKPGIPRGRRLLPSIVVAALLVSAGMAVYVRHGTGSAVSAATAPRPPLVSVTTSRREDLSDQLKLSAEFLPFQEISVYARVAGYVRQMRVDVGDRVHAGDVIAILEIPELDNDLQRAAAAT